MILKQGKERVLVISDMQAPFQHKDTLPFLKTIADSIQPTKVVNIGDSMDLHGLGRFDPDPSGHSPMKEIDKARKFLSKLYDEFPEGVEVASNHNARLARKAFSAGIPEELIAGQRELTGAPSGWVFQRNVEYDGVLYTHGEEFGGLYGARRAPEIAGQSVVFGHSHASAGVMYRAVENQTTWGMNVGCLLDFETYAFNYARTMKYKPTLGTGVVVNNVPYFIPMFLNKKGRWTGEIIV